MTCTLCILYINIVYCIVVLVEFKEIEYFVSETDGFAEVCLVKYNTTTSDTKVFISACPVEKNGTEPATPNIDFVTFNLREIIFGPDEFEKCSRITILEDNEEEQEETFGVCLTKREDHSHILIGDKDTAVVEISDGIIATGRYRIITNQKCTLFSNVLEVAVETIILKSFK